MVSTDGSRGDDEREEGSPDESVFPPGPRRSTYTPPESPAGAVPGAADVGPEPETEPETADAVDPEIEEPDALPEVTVDPSPASRIPSDLPAFVPPPPPAPDFEFLKPETAPVNVVYQLDDIQPDLPFGVNVETLASSPAGARILPKEQPAPPSEPEPIVMGSSPIAESAPVEEDEPEQAVTDEAPTAFDLPFSEASSAPVFAATAEPDAGDEAAEDAEHDETASDGPVPEHTDGPVVEPLTYDLDGGDVEPADDQAHVDPPIVEIPDFEAPVVDDPGFDIPAAGETLAESPPASDGPTAADNFGEQPGANVIDDSLVHDDQIGDSAADEQIAADEQVDHDRPVFEIP